MLIGNRLQSWDVGQSGGGSSLNTNDTSDTVIFTPTAPTPPLISQLCYDGTWLYGVSYVSLHSIGTVSSVYRIDPATMSATLFFTCTNVTYGGPGASVCTDGTYLYVVGSDGGLAGPTTKIAWTSGNSYTAGQIVIDTHLARAGLSYAPIISTTARSIDTRTQPGPFGSRTAELSSKNGQ